MPYLPRIVPETGDVSYVDAAGRGTALESRLQNGPTTGRPNPPSVGLEYFDTTLGYPVWYDGTNWVDATGATV